MLWGLSLIDTMRLISKSSLRSKTKRIINRILLNSIERDLIRLTILIRNWIISRLMLRDTLFQSKEQLI